MRGLRAMDTNYHRNVNPVNSILRLPDPNDSPRLMEKLSSTPKKELMTFVGGEDRDDPCDALAYHGFNGLENEVVGKIAEWIIQTK